MEEIIKGLRFNTATAKLLGQRVSQLFANEFVKEHLYQTHTGHRFFYHHVYYLKNMKVITIRESIRPCTIDEAYAWANKYNPEAQEHLSEPQLPLTAQDLVLLADYRSGSPRRPKSYVHHVIFGTQDKSVYYIASNRIIEPIDYQTQVVSVTGVEDVKDFTERMCVRDMNEEYARAWAEDHLPPRVYAKCFEATEA